jgi:hypothetical protein
MKGFSKSCIFLSLVLFFAIAHSVSASSTIGTVDPSGLGKYHAQFVHTPSSSGSENINFGKFTTESQYNITITDAGIRGYAWGSEAGWIVMNCADTTSGCSSTNGNFKVSVGSTGVLSGYAWGEKTGWINFGPFIGGSAASQVVISQTGQFSGYAWSARYGWIVFDCNSTATCVTTDYIPSTYRATTGPITVVGVGSGGGTVDPISSSISESEEPTSPIIPPQNTPTSSTNPPHANPSSDSPYDTVQPINPPQGGSVVVPKNTKPPVVQQNLPISKIQKLKAAILPFLKKWGPLLFFGIIILVLIIRRLLMLIL